MPEPVFHEKIRSCEHVQPISDIHAKPFSIRTFAKRLSLLIVGRTHSIAKPTIKTALCFGFKVVRGPYTGPPLGPCYNTAPTIEGTQKGTIILTTTHLSAAEQSISQTHPGMSTPTPTPRG